jgi:hypothetical protein
MRWDLPSAEKPQKDVGLIYVLQPEPPGPAVPPVETAKDHDRLVNVALDFEWQGQRVTDHFVWDSGNKDMANIRSFALGLLFDSFGPKLATFPLSAVDGNPRGGGRSRVCDEGGGRDPRANSGGGVARALKVGRAA